MPRAAQSYRFGGEATLPSVIVARARDAFLYAVDELYPQVLDDLLELAARAGRPNLAGCTPGDFADWLLVPEIAPPGWPELVEAIEAWARRWRLQDRGRIPRWLLDAALDAISRYQAHGWGWWSIGWGGAVPDRCEVLPPIPMTPELGRALPAGLRGILTLVLRDGETQLACYYYPDLYGSGRFKRAIRENAKTVYRIWRVTPEQACRRIDSLVSEALAAGATPGEWHADREPLDWAVKATVGGMTYEAIAAAEWRVGPDTVAKHVKRLLRLIGLRRIPNRPRK
jgi:hypothetical protein